MRWQSCRIVVLSSAAGRTRLRIPISTRGARGRRNEALHDQSDLCCRHERRQAPGAQIATVRNWRLTELLGPAFQQDSPGFDGSDGEHFRSDSSCLPQVAPGTACSEGAEIACRISRSPDSGPPRTMNPSSTRESIKCACSSQPGSSRRSRDQSHGPPRRGELRRTSAEPYDRHPPRARRAALAFIWRGARARRLQCDATMRVGRACMLRLA